MESGRDVESCVAGRSWPSLAATIASMDRCDHLGSRDPRSRVNRRFFGLTMTFNGSAATYTVASI